MNLRLLQLGDSALPIGGYSQSWGLEAAVEQGSVRDPAGLESWVRSWLRYAVGPCEGVVVASTCRAAGAGDWWLVAEANDLLWASLCPPTLRHASRDLGEQLLRLAEVWPWAVDAAHSLQAVALSPLSPRGRGVGGEGGCGLSGTMPPPHPQPLSPEGRGEKEKPLSPEGRGEKEWRPPSEFPGWHHAPVFGALAAAAGATPREAVLVYLHQAALGAIGAGVKVIPIGHTHGQQILAYLHQAIDSLAADLAGRDLTSAGSFCPAYEVLCHAQQALYTRLFRS